jgi:hypothetical protein
MGGGVIGQSAALKIWRSLLNVPWFICSVFHANPPIRGHRLVGFGAAVFVASDFMEAELAAPRADVNSRLFAEVQAGRPVLLDRSGVARANAGPGLEVLILYGAWLEEIMNAAEAAEARAAFPIAFAELINGYRIRRFLYETRAEPQHRFAEMSGVYRCIAEFPEMRSKLFVSDRDQANLVPASLANVLFRFSEPVFRLAESDQQLLRAAARGSTDTELARELGVSIPAIKARWRSTFARISEVMPDLCQHVGNGTLRGAQKRHRVLAYIRAHPEELRPYAPQ